VSIIREKGIIQRTHNLCKKDCRKKLKEEADMINQADTTFLLISSALVMLMTPALGLFYGRMVRVNPDGSNGL